MDTRFLDSFITVVDNGSIAEAARRLNLTPAAVAQRIRTLESEIGARLIVRSGRAVRPTDAGTSILARARNLLGEARYLKSIATDDAPAGELRLGAIPTAITGILPYALRLLMDKYPQIDVHIIRDTSERLYHSVLNGDLDAAIIVEPPFAFPKACGWQVFREEPLIVLTSAAVSGRNAHAILAKEPFIRYDRNNWAGRLVDSYLRRADIRPRERFELAGLEAIAVMVDRGLGVSLVPDWTPPWPEGLSIRKLPLPANSFARRIGLLWTRASLRVRLVHTFIEEAATTNAVGEAIVSKSKRNKGVPRR